MKTLSGILFIISLIVAPAHSEITADDNLNETERNIQQQLNQNLAQANLLLKKTVNINSGTMNFKGVKAVGEVYLQELKKLGLETQWVDGEQFNRAGHLLATYSAPKSPNALKIMMIGHLDTVFAENDSFQAYTEKDKRFVAGPGITDMKGGNVIIIETIRALKQLKLLDNVSIKIVMTGDEEKSGRPLSLSKKAIIDAAKWADIALGFEDGDGDIKTAVIARRGAIGWTLKVTGKPAHSSQIFREDIGYGAIYEAARILNQFRLKLIKEEFFTLNPGLVAGGTQVEHDSVKNQSQAFGKSNVIAQTAILTGDIRALSPEQEIKVKQIMQAIVKDNLPHTSAVIEFDEGYPPMAPTQGNQKLLKLYSQVSQDLGYGDVQAVNPRRAGAADISFAANYVNMALDGMGLMGDGGHTKDEVADMDSFAKNMHKAAILIYRLSKQEL